MRNQLKMASTGKTDKSNQNCWPFSVPFCGQVMWVRRTVDKFSLLSVGNVTHTGDPRFKVTFQYPNNWRLHINPMQKDDAGIYMCQVSTHPPRVFTTNVTVMREYKSFYVLLFVQPWCSNIYVWQVRIWFHVCVCVCVFAIFVCIGRFVIIIYNTHMYSKRQVMGRAIVAIWIQITLW